MKAKLQYGTNIVEVEVLSFDGVKASVKLNGKQTITILRDQLPKDLVEKLDRKFLNRPKGGPSNGFTLRKSK